jgi:hypothetical protein
MGFIDYPMAIDTAPVSYHIDLKILNSKRLARGMVITYGWLLGHEQGQFCAAAIPRNCWSRSVRNYMRCTHHILALDTDSPIVQSIGL